MSFNSDRFRLHEKVRKFVRIEQQKLPSTEIPVRLSFGSSNGVPNGVAESQQKASLRGPSDAVEDLAEKIVAFVEAEKQDEKERGYITSFDFPQKYANFLIGKRGENINKYREEFGVDIQVNEGKVEIKGPKAKAELAKSKIQLLGKKLEDEATHVLKIKPQYHRDMIGAKGSQVNRLQDRYNVRVQFPRTAPPGGDDRSVTDGASDVGGPRNGRANQAADEVIIRGPKKGADEARDELLNLLQWTIDNSHTATVSVSQTQLPSLIGQGGREMENIRLATGAQIDVPGNRESVDPTGRVQIQIKGTKKSVEEAKKLLEERAKVFDDSVTKSIDVDKKHHKALIGSGGKFSCSFYIAMQSLIHFKARIFVILLSKPEALMTDEILPALSDSHAKIPMRTPYVWRGTKHWSRALLPQLKLSSIRGTVRLRRLLKWRLTSIV